MAKDTPTIKYEEQNVQPNAITMLRDIWGTINTVSTAPTHIPRKLDEQVLLYSSGGTFRLYVYDRQNAAWRYVALT